MLPPPSSPFPHAVLTAPGPDSVPTSPRTRIILGRIAKWGSLGLIVIGLVGCAHDNRDPNRLSKRESGHRWYQGEMNNDERSFFLDSFFSN